MAISERKGLTSNTQGKWRISTFFILLISVNSVLLPWIPLILQFSGLKYLGTAIVMFLTTIFSVLGVKFSLTLITFTRNGGFRRLILFFLLSTSLTLYVGSVFFLPENVKSVTCSKLFEITPAVDYSTTTPYDGYEPTMHNTSIDTSEKTTSKTTISTSEVTSSSVMSPSSFTESTTTSAVVPSTTSTVESNNLESNITGISTSMVDNSTITDSTPPTEILNETLSNVTESADTTDDSSSTNNETTVVENDHNPDLNETSLTKIPSNSSVTTPDLDLETVKTTTSTTPPTSHHKHNKKGHLHKEDKNSQRLQRQNRITFPDLDVNEQSRDAFVNRENDYTSSYGLKQPEAEYNNDIYYRSDDENPSLTGDVRFYDYPSSYLRYKRNPVEIKARNPRSTKISTSNSTKSSEVNSNETSIPNILPADTSHIWLWVSIFLIVASFLGSGLESSVTRLWHCYSHGYHLFQNSPRYDMGGDDLLERALTDTFELSASGEHYGRSRLVGGIVVISSAIIMSLSCKLGLPPGWSLMGQVELFIFGGLLSIICLVFVLPIPYGSIRAQKAPRPLSLYLDDEVLWEGLRRIASPTGTAVHGMLCSLPKIYVVNIMQILAVENNLYPDPLIVFGVACGLIGEGLILCCRKSIAGALDPPGLVSLALGLLAMQMMGCWFLRYGAVLWLISLSWTVVGMSQALTLISVRQNALMLASISDQEREAWISWCSGQLGTALGVLVWPLVAGSRWGEGTLHYLLLPLGICSAVLSVLVFIFALLTRSRRSARRRVYHTLDLHSVDDDSSDDDEDWLVKGARREGVPLD